MFGLSSRRRHRHRSERQSSERPWQRIRPVPRYEPGDVVVALKCHGCGYLNGLSGFDIPRRWQHWKALSCDKCTRHLGSGGPLGFLVVRLRHLLAELREDLRYTLYWFRYLPRRVWRAVQRVLGLT